MSEIMEKAIRSLRRLNYLRNAVDSMEDEIREMENAVYGIKASQTDKVIVSGGACENGDDHILLLISEIDDLRQKYEISKAELKATEKALASLKDEERILLMARYVDNIRGFESFIMDKLSIERASVYRKLKRAIENYCVARFGGDR